MFDLNLLRTFSLMMHTRKVSQTAEILGMTPSAVSQSLNRLREHFNDHMFVRQGAIMVPTQVAEELYRSMEPSLAQVLSLLNRDEEFEPQNSNRTFRLASHADIDLLLFAPLVKHVNVIAPGVKVCFDSCQQEAQLVNLRLRQYEAMLSIAPEPDPSLRSIELCRLPLVVTYRPDHPRLQDSKSISVEQFFSEQHILWQPKRYTRSVLQSLTEEVLPERHCVYDSSSMATSLTLCRDSNWLCVTTMLHAKPYLESKHLCFSPIPFKTEQLPIYLTWHQAMEQDPGFLWLKQQLIIISGQLSSTLGE
ncbi:LysR family transcriptional regulator [Vibrio sp. S4M6]|uniref:LysR family transcriptional regulator n=1 Tax=Vibrio sinus TaxID=2946865 RepID=UPI00202A7E8F|nr:LysR family transcriptional regulator [Vibrio sinus]MCL9780671.1 LysR family transcriptional regulator [Vibrio sinus]